MTSSATGVRFPAIVTMTSLALFSQTALSQGLEEVVITAQKRAQNMQDVPIAVTAMNAEMLAEAGITNVTGVAARTPGFSMGEFNPTQPQLYIRGIGSNGDGAASGEQSVAMFIDGVYVPRSAGTGLELFDIETIEVLRGPQGTLWGKNAIGGAINITTRKPSDALEMGVEFSAGDLGLKDFRGMVTGPLIDNLNGKLSINYKERDSYIDSVYDASVETGGLESRGLRGQLSWLASDSLEFLLTASYGDDERTQAAAMADMETGMMGAALQEAIADGLPEADFYENYLDIAGETSMQNQGLALQADWDLGEMTLTSITSYTENEASFYNNGFGVAPEIFYNYGFFGVNSVGPLLAGIESYNYMDEESSLFSEELRLAGQTDSLSWQTGVYFSIEDVDRTEGNLGRSPMFIINRLGFAGALAYSPNDDRARQINTTTSYAAFGEITYSLSEKLDLTAGLRYTAETKDYENIGTTTSGNPGVPVLEMSYADEKTWSSPTYKLVATYHATDDVMTYLSAATGFKSGGYGYVTPLGSTELAPFDEEQAINYEWGVKSTFLDGSLRMNAALFRTEYEDLQVLQQFPCEDCSIPPLVTKNAGEAISQGLELEMTYLLGEHLTFTGSYAYLDATYEELEGTLAVDEGNTLRNAPKNAYTAAVNYETELGFGIGGSVRARLEYLHKEKAYQDTANYEYSAIPEYRVFNGRLAYTSEDGSWDLALWGQNLANEEYMLHNFSLPPLGAVHIAATPRTWGATVTWNYF